MAFVFKSTSVYVRLLASLIRSASITKNTEHQRHTHLAGVEQTVRSPAWRALPALLGLTTTAATESKGYKTSDAKGSEGG